MTFISTILGSLTAFLAWEIGSSAVVAATVVGVQRAKERGKFRNLRRNIARLLDPPTDVIDVTPKES